MNKQLGTKWFTFYTKVRPWFGCLSALGVIADFTQYQEVYTSYWWMMVYFLAALVQPVLSIMVFVKSRGNYEDFVRFVKGVLLFETFNMAYGQAVNQYIQNELDIGVALVVGVIMLLLGYFIWYRLNMKYFKKRIIDITNDYLPDDLERWTECKVCGYKEKDIFYECPQCGNYASPYKISQEKPAQSNQVSFCHNCGEKLIENSRFCRKCGTEVPKT